MMKTESPQVQLQYECSAIYKCSPVMWYRDNSCNDSWGGRGGPGSGSAAAAAAAAGRPAVLGLGLVTVTEAQAIFGLTRVVLTSLGGLSVRKQETRRWATLDTQACAGWLTEH